MPFRQKTGRVLQHLSWRMWILPTTITDHGTVNHLTHVDTLSHMTNHSPHINEMMAMNEYDKQLSNDYAIQVS